MFASVLPDRWNIFINDLDVGIAIVKHIVERHRGRLDIASELGVGTTITVRLPRHVEDESKRLKKTVA